MVRCRWWPRGGARSGVRTRRGRTDGLAVPPDRPQFLSRRTLAVLFPPCASLLISALHGRAWAFWIHQHPIPPPGRVVDHPQGGPRGQTARPSVRAGAGWTLRPGCFGCCGRERGATCGCPPVLQWWGHFACIDPPTSPNGGQIEPGCCTSLGEVVAPPVCFPSFPDPVRPCRANTSGRRGGRVTPASAYRSDTPPTPGGGHTGLRRRGADDMETRWRGVSGVWLANRAGRGGRGRASAGFRAACLAGGRVCVSYVLVMPGSGRGRPR